MIPLFLWTAGAAAAPPAVGLPLARLDAIGLELPSVPAVAPLSMRYPLAGGRGFVVMVVAPSDREAATAFDGMARTLATRWAPAPVGAPLPGDRTLGDGAGALLVQSGNVALMVRDREGRAAAVAEQMLSALASDPAACAGDAVLPDGRTADGCGRPR